MDRRDAVLGGACSGMKIPIFGIWRSGREVPSGTLLKLVRWRNLPADSTPH